ncbi:cupredoxin domain-containing protein [Streptomyces sp. NPDC003758]
MHHLTAPLRPARAVRLLLATLLLAATATLLTSRPAHAVTSYRVVMSDYAFSPRSLTISAGDTVTWVNQDQAPHDVKTTSGPESIHSPMLNKGATWSHTFTSPGTYGYVCTVHPGMIAQLVVKAAAAPTPTAHQHTGSTAAAPQPARSAAAAGPTAHTGRSAAAAAPVSSSPSPSPTTAAPAAAPAQQAVEPTDSTASAARPLDPLLLLAGLVAGVAVLCLLLVGSRSSAAHAPPTTPPSST